MDDFGMFARDFGIRPHGKSAAVSASSPRPPASSTWTSTPPAATVPFVADDEPLFGPHSKRPSNVAYDDVFGGPPKYSTRYSPSPLDSFSQGPSAAPTFDDPVYDDDIFDGVPGMKSPGSAKYEDVFSSASAAENSSCRYDDVLGGLGRAEPEPKTKPRSGGGGLSREASGFDDLIPGFGGSGSPSAPTPKR